MTEIQNDLASIKAFIADAYPPYYPHDPDADRWGVYALTVPYNRTGFEEGAKWAFAQVTKALTSTEDGTVQA